MTAEFMDKYLHTKHKSEKQLYWCFNPTKARSSSAVLYHIHHVPQVRVCEYLVDYHKNRGDKVILFSDNIATLKEYCKTYLNIPYIYGKTGEEERKLFLDSFKRIGSSINVIGLSKVGDTALDIPEANVIIQVRSTAFYSHH
jgi:DNA excision repair protein ERCC-3